MHLWADHFDAPAADVFDIQDRITASVIGAIEPTLRQAEIERARRKPADNLQVYDLVLRSRFTFGQPTSDALEESRRLLQQAVELDPDDPMALAWLARVHWSIDAQHFRFPSVAEVGRYVRVAQRAVALAQDDPEVLVIASVVIGLPGGDFAEATAPVDRALSLNPNSADAWAMSGMLQAYLGNAETALTLLERSVQLCPLNLWVNWQDNAFARAHFVAGRYEDALVRTARGLHRCPNPSDEAREVVRRLRAVVPELTLSRLPEVGAILYKRVAGTSVASEAQLEGLRRAGLPE